MTQLTPRPARFDRANHIFGPMRKLALSAVLILPLSACAGVGADYRPIIDGPVNASYAADLNDCRAVAQQRKYVNADTQNDALLGAVVGGLLGLTESGDDGENFVAGALIGGAAGGLGSAYEARDERKDIVRNCMAGRGHRVVG